MPNQLFQQQYFERRCKTNAFSNTTWELLQHLWFNHPFQKYYSRTNVFSIFPKIMLPKLLVVQQFSTMCCPNHWFDNASNDNVAKTIGLTTLPKTIYLNLLFTIPKARLLNCLTVDMFENNVVESTGFNNSVQPLVLRQLQNKCR